MTCPRYTLTAICLCFSWLLIRVSPTPTDLCESSVPLWAVRFAPVSAFVGPAEVVCSKWTLRSGHSRSLRVCRPTSLFSAVILLLAGDIETNPGPGPKHPCATCSKAVKSNQRGIFCEVCYQWHHAKCISMCLSEYQRLSLSDEGWCCHRCHKEAFPFHDSSRISTEPESSPLSCCSISSDTPPLSPTGSCLVYYSNCRSLLPKMDHLRATVASSTPSIIALCETWLDETIPDSALFIHNFHLIRRDRNRHGGGLAIYVSDDIPSIILYLSASLSRAPYCRTEIQTRLTHIRSLLPPSVICF